MSLLEPKAGMAVLLKIFIKIAAMKKALFMIAVLFISVQVRAQNTEQSGWVSWLSSFKVYDKLGAHFDLQVRTADRWDYVRQVIIRPGVTYSFNPRQNVTLGYANINTFTRLVGVSDNQLTENRIWEQFIQTHKIKKVFAMHRFRLEQRFIERRGAENLFSQRFRYFARFVVPFKKYDQVFAKGPYIAGQNELFLHLQNKNDLNKSTFDQNRAYVAAGIRLSPKIDVEIGYLNQYINGPSNYTTNHVAQLGILTRL